MKALVPLLLAACTARPIPVAATYWDDARLDALEEASELLDYPLEPTRDSDTAPVVRALFLPYGYIFEPGTDIAGFASTRQRGGRRTLVSIVGGVELAHELGHTFALRHVNDDLMAPDPHPENFRHAARFERRASRWVRRHDDKNEGMR